MELTPTAAAILVLAAVAAVIRGLEVRLTLFGTALLIGLIAGDPMAIIRTFLGTFSNEKFVLPVCSAMGFAYVIRHTGCDQHLVRLLMVPARRMKALVIPGVVLAAFVVNVPVISQTSVAVCVGPVAIPLMRAAGFTPLAAGATLCLGASCGGELLNPGAPELRTITDQTGTAATRLARTEIPRFLFPYAAVALLVHWLLTAMLEPRAHRQPADAPPTEGPISLIQAAVPLVPLAFLFATGPPLNWIRIPKEVLSPDGPDKFDTRLIAVAMLIGVAAAALVRPPKVGQCLKQFFDGAGYGFAVVVSLIVTANCFGEAIRLSGLANVLGDLLSGRPALLVPAATFAPYLFALLSGSGMASTQSLYGFFYEPAVALGRDPDAVGAAVAVGSAAGRTMSPVAAVVLMCATLTDVKPGAIVKRLALPLLAGLAAAANLRIIGLL